MSIPEASQLVLQAGAQGKGGGSVLDMGQPVLILDPARDLIRLSGLPEDSIEIEFSGIRPGEKLYEELYFDEEHSLPTDHPKIFAAYRRQFPAEEVANASSRSVTWSMLIFPANSWLPCSRRRFPNFATARPTVFVGLRKHNPPNRLPLRANRPDEPGSHLLAV